LGFYRSLGFETLSTYDCTGMIWVDRKKFKEFQEKLGIRLNWQNLLTTEETYLIVVSICLLTFLFHNNLPKEATKSGGFFYVQMQKF